METNSCKDEDSKLDNDVLFNLAKYEKRFPKPSFGSDKHKAIVNILSKCSSDILM